jgi:hypothetical protein
LFLVHETAGSRYNFISDRAHSDWVVVYGGDLPVAVDVRIERAADGRHIFTGLRIGMGKREEITAQTLREIRLAEILADYFETFQPDYEAQLNLAEASFPLRPRGPGNDALRGFARTYLTELARQPHRAMSAAAKAHNISRATANRWAATCRDLGYLPGTTSGEDPSS